MNSDTDLIVVGPAPDAPLAALYLRRLMPRRPLTLVITPDEPDPIGETATPLLLQQLANVMGIAREDLHLIAKPVWSLGYQMKWGARGSFARAFEAPFASTPGGHTTPVAALAVAEGFSNASTGIALLEAGKLFPRDRKNSIRIIDQICGLQLAPAPFTELLVRGCKAAGATVIHGTPEEIRVEKDRVSSITVNGSELPATGMVIDLTGRDALIRKHLPGHAWSPTTADGLCTRAWTAVRRRGSEPIRSGAMVETLDGGWRWRVEHRESIGFGLAFHPEFTSEEEALRLLREKVDQPIAEPRLHQWEHGHHAETWVGNVVAMGSTASFLGPLTGTRLPMILQQIHHFGRLIAEAETKPGETCRRLFHISTRQAWQEIHDFTSILHRFNTASESAWWQHSREHASCGDHEEFLALYQQGGAHPVLHHALPFGNSALGLDTWLAALVGLGIPVAHPPRIPAAALEAWRSQVKANADTARSGVTQAVFIDAMNTQIGRRPKPEKFYGD